MVKPWRIMLTLMLALSIHAPGVVHSEEESTGTTIIVSVQTDTRDTFDGECSF